jgi:hypothetical protein
MRHVATSLMGHERSLSGLVFRENPLKSLVNAGVFSIVLMGTDDAAPLFRAEELVSRCKTILDFGRFDVKVPDDRNYFFGFTGHLERKMLEKGIVDRPIG